MTISVERNSRTYATPAVVQMRMQLEWRACSWLTFPIQWRCVSTAVSWHHSSALTRCCCRNCQVEEALQSSWTHIRVNNLTNDKAQIDTMKRLFLEYFLLLDDLFQHFSGSTGRESSACMTKPEFEHLLAHSKLLFLPSHQVRRFGVGVVITESTLSNRISCCRKRLTPSSQLQMQTEAMTTTLSRFLLASSCSNR